MGQSPPAPPPPGGDGGSPAAKPTPGAGNTPHPRHIPGVGDQVAAWRVARATREMDNGVQQAWAEREATLTRQRGAVDGKLDTTLERRSGRLEQMQVITKPTDEERALARGHSDHALLEQMHQAGRATDKLPPPLIRATKTVNRDLTAAQREELRSARRARELNDALHKAKAHGASPAKLAQLDQQRTKARQQHASAREWQRDLRADREAIHQRTQQLQQANDDHGRVLSRAVAAVVTLVERGVDVTRWAEIIAHPTRQEERAVQLGGRETARELAAENHTDRTRRLEAIRDRAQMGQFIASTRPPPAKQQKAKQQVKAKEKEQEKEHGKQEKTRERNRNRDGRGRSR